MATSSTSLLSKLNLLPKAYQAFDEEEFEKQQDILERSTHVRLKLLGEHSLFEGEKIRDVVVEDIPQLYKQVEDWLGPKLGTTGGNWRLSNAGGWPLQEEAMSKPTSSACPLVVYVRKIDPKESGSKLDDMRLRLEERLVSLKAETENEIKALKQELKQQSDKLTDLTAQVVVWKPGGQAEKGLCYKFLAIISRKRNIIAFIAYFTVLLIIFAFHTKTEMNMDGEIHRFHAKIRNLTDQQNGHDKFLKTLRENVTSAFSEISSTKKDLGDLTSSVNTNLMAVDGIQTNVTKVNATLWHVHAMVQQNKHDIEANQHDVNMGMSNLKDRLKKVSGLSDSLAADLREVNASLQKRSREMEASHRAELEDNYHTLSARARKLTHDLDKVVANVSQQFSLLSGLGVNLSKVNDSLNNHSASLSAELHEFNASFRRRSDHVEVMVGHLKLVDRNLTDVLEKVNTTLENQSQKIEASVTKLKGNVKTLTQDLQKASTALEKQSQRIEAVSEASVTKLMGNVKTLTQDLQKVNTTLEKQSQSSEASVTKLMGNVKTLTQDLQKVNTTLEKQSQRIEAVSEASVTKLMGNVKTLTQDLQKVNGSLTNLSMNVTANLSEVNATLHGKTDKIEAELLKQKAANRRLVVKLEDLQHEHDHVMKEMESSREADAAKVDASVKNLSANLLADLRQVKTTAQHRSAQLEASVGNLKGAVQSLTKDLKKVNGSLTAAAQNFTANLSQVNASLLNWSQYIEEAVTNITTAWQNVTHDVLEVNASLHNLSANLTSNLSQVNATVENTSDALKGLKTSVGKLTGDLQTLRGSFQKAHASVQADLAKDQKELTVLMTTTTTPAAPKNLQAAQADKDPPPAGFLETPRIEEEPPHAPPAVSPTERLAGIDAQLSRIVSRLDEHAS